MKFHIGVIACIAMTTSVAAFQDNTETGLDDAEVQCLFQIDSSRNLYVDEAGFKRACIDFYRDDPAGQIAAKYGACMIAAKQRLFEKAGPGARPTKADFNSSQNDCVAAVGGFSELKTAVKASKKAWKAAGLDDWETTPRKQ